MKQINLYQAAFHPPQIVMPARRLLAGGLVFLAGLLALYAWDAWRLAQLRREVAQLAAQADKLEARVKVGTATHQADPGLLAEAEAMETRLRNLELARTALASGALGSTRGYAAHFRGLSRTRVDGAWLTHIEVEARGQAMSLRGRALAAEDSARLIASLRREPLFAGLSFSGLSLAPPKDEAPEADSAARPAAPRFLEFTLSARQAPAAEAASATPPDQAALPADPAALAAALAAGKLNVNAADANAALQAAAARSAP